MLKNGGVRAWSVFQASLAAVSDVVQEKEDGLWFSFCGCVRDDGHVMVQASSTTARLLVGDLACGITWFGCLERE